MSRASLTGFKYSGGAVMIQQLALMDAVGKPFEEVARKWVLDPIGMINSTFEHPLAPQREKQAARAHNRLDARMGDPWHVYPEQATAGLWTTPTDLARFAVEVRRSLLGKSNRLWQRRRMTFMDNQGVGHVDSAALGFSIAAEAEVLALAALLTAVAKQLTREFGPGHWSRAVTKRGVRYDLKMSRTLVARRGPDVVATLRLATQKPWAIDVAYFTPVPRALYLHDMAVAPGLQRQGIGRHLVCEAISVARAWPSQAIRLDAYDAAAGARAFYGKCGFREVGRVTYRKVPLIYFELLL